MKKSSNVSQMTREKLKQLHKKEIFLHTLRSGAGDGGGISRAELTEKMKLSFPSVSALVDEMIEGGILVETGALEMGVRGRPRTLLRVRSDYVHVPVLELLGDGYRLVVFDLYGNVLEERFCPFCRDPEAGEWRPRMEALCAPAEAAVQGMEDKYKLSDMMITLPGNINEQGAFSSSSASMVSPPSFLENLEAAVGRKVIPMNRADCFAYAERLYSPVSKDYIFLHISEGVGAGIIRDGQVFRSEPWRAGEIGHMSVNFDGPRCKCGNRGCLELYISTTAIARECAPFTGDCADYGKVVRSYNQGNADIVPILMKKTRILVSALNNVFALHPVSDVIIGGTITQLGDDFLRQLETEIANHTSRMYKGKFTIAFSKNYSDDSTIGAFHNYVDHIMKL